MPLNHKLVQETTICTNTTDLLGFSRGVACVGSGFYCWILAESKVSKLSSYANINHKSPIFSRIFSGKCVRFV